MSSVAMEASWSSSAASSTAMAAAPAAGAGAGVGDDDMAAVLGRRAEMWKGKRLQGLDLRKGLMGIPPRLATQYGVVYQYGDPSFGLFVAHIPVSARSVYHVRGRPCHEM
jgi:hypothetical protein